MVQLWARYVLTWITLAGCVICTTKSKQWCCPPCNVPHSLYVAVHYQHVFSEQRDKPRRAGSLSTENCILCTVYTTVLLITLSHGVMTAYWILCNAESHIHGARSLHVTHRAAEGHSYYRPSEKFARLYPSWVFGTRVLFLWINPNDTRKLTRPVRVD